MAQIKSLELHYTMIQSLIITHRNYKMAETKRYTAVLGPRKNTFDGNKFAHFRHKTFIMKNPKLSLLGSLRNIFFKEKKNQGLMP